MRKKDLSNNIYGYTHTYVKLRSDMFKVKKWCTVISLGNWNNENW